MTEQEKKYYELRSIGEKMYPFLDGLNQHEIETVLDSIRSLVRDSAIVAKIK